MKINKWSIGYALALTGLTTYLLLDAFVIPNVYQKNVSLTESSQIQSMSERENITDSEPAAEATIADSESTTDNQPAASQTTQEEATPKDYAITPEEPQIEISTCRVNDTNVYVADILLPSVESLKTAFAQDTYGRKITATTSDTATENDAILAINGDFYGARERGYVIRNGILYRDTPSNADVLCIYTDGRMEIVDPQEKSAQELLDNGAWQVFSFGPGLLEDGEILVDTNDEVGMAMASNPRTAIGMIEPNHYIFVVSDGRTSDNEGLSLYELADFMKNLGVATAYNLDGGGSSTMVYQGEIINTPSSGRHSRERSVSDIVYIR
ncbi:MAG: phosphodiester glycosidase family protein [Lachnospiraceae bacterium]|nr:phosphodiester glycosidase family protein [Lachnospiraceae bacterium]